MKLRSVNRLLERFLKQPSRIVIVGTSAGGVEALKQLVSRLPENFPAALLAVSDGLQLRVTRGPKENRFRPSIDVLFRSAAYTLGARVVGVVLTGQLDDGTSGLWAVKDRGGIAVVQSPRTALFPSMPMSALQHVAVDHVVDLEQLPELLMQLALESVPRVPQEVTATMHTENEIAGGGDPLRAGSLELGKKSSLTCPECHGVLSELREGSIMRFRCHTGHAYSMQALLADIDDSIDSSLAGVLRTLHERAILLGEAAALARKRNDSAGAEKLERRARECDDRSRTIRDLLQDPTALVHDTSLVREAKQ
jgi:two-component system chemotaxis response regulator CheB